MLISGADLRYTLRQLAKSPGFTLLAIVVLAGGLGLSIFIFTVTYIMHYKPIDMTHGDRIVEVCADGGFGWCLPLKPYEFAAIRDDITTLENTGLYRPDVGNLQVDDAFYEVMVTSTEWNMFQLSESSALLGRVLQESDQDPQAEPVTVLAYDFWQLAFAGDPGVVDTHINLGGTPRRVVGVMPEGFKFPRWSDVWVPVSSALLAPLQNELTVVSVYARRAPGVSSGQASDEMASLMFRMRQQNPPDPSLQMEGNQRLINEADSGFVTSLPQRDMGGVEGRLMLATINLMAGMVFLLACINIGTLLLARTNERLKDLSIRVALGVPRTRLLVQALSECIVIALVGALLAVMIAGLGLEGLNLLLTTMIDDEGLQFWIDFRVDGSTLFAALLFALLTVLLTSALPSWRLINGDFNSVMRDGTRGAAGLRAGRFSKSLVIVAIAMITVVLHVGTFTIYSMWNMGRTYALIDPEGMASVEIETLEQFDSAGERLQFYQAVQRRLSNLPEVSDVMMIGMLGRRALEPDGVIYLSDEDRPDAPVQVFAGDLTTIGANLLEGRYFDATDNQGGLRSALVSRSLAERLWPGRSPLGMNLRIEDSEQSAQSPSFRIVGMISNTPMDGQDRFKQDTDMVYLPLGQMDSENITAVIRSSHLPQEAVQALQMNVMALNSGVRLSTLSWVEDRQMVGSLILAVITLLTFCGIFAFLISIAGIFGLTKNAVILRSQEIGTRRALGARDKIILRTFTVTGIKQMLWGFAISLLLTIPFSMVIGSAQGLAYLFEASLVVLVVIVLLFICVIAAIHQPIRQILKREPGELLRHQ